MKQKNYVMLTIRASGAVDRRVQPKPPTLGQLQRCVGGLIETVPLFTRCEPYQRGKCYANEEGMLRDLPRNLTATVMWQAQCGRPLTQWLHGDVVYVARTEEAVP